jgi:hypothetical protein
MKNLIIVLGVLALITYRPLCQESRIDTFEEFLGLEYSDLLTKRVESLDQFIRDNFYEHILSEGYRKYLKTIESGEFKRSDWDYSNTGIDSLNALFERSGLWKEIYEKPDTVWIEGDKLHFKTTYFDGQDTLVGEGYNLGQDIGQISNVDSLIQHEMNNLTFNLYGKFLRGMDLVQALDSTIILYVDAKQAAGNISPEIIASALLKMDANLSDYFVKRIIAIELF